jgi:hypothetical protein
MKEPSFKVEGVGCCLLPLCAFVSLSGKRPQMKKIAGGVFMGHHPTQAMNGSSSISQQKLR